MKPATRVDPIEAARQRRAASAQLQNTRIEFFLTEVLGKVKLSTERRVKVATQYVQSKVITNISRPVTKRKGGRQGRDEDGRFKRKTIRVYDRSKPGEFPKADTTQLMKTIFSGVETDDYGVYGYVGTPLDYGLILETRMDRSFLMRTLLEEQSIVQRILTEPMKESEK